jgi:glycosyltransferase involved in cell wall biosynthesis
MRVILSHPTGNQFVRALISALNDNDLLSEFHTTISVDPEKLWLKLLPGKIKNELLRRSFTIPNNKIVTHPFLEMARMGLPKMGFKSHIKHETGWASVDAVYQHIDKQVAHRLSFLSRSSKVDAVYAYEDGAAFSFAEAKRLNIKCFYDLPIGYWRAAQILLRAEQERWPDWAATLTGFQDSEYKLQRKDEELRLADRIFVASKFTAKTLDYYPGTLPPVKVVPYGFPPVAETKTYNVDLSVSRPLKLLFVGGLSQRKGIADLFAAVSIFGPRVELTVVGNKVNDNCPVLNETLKKHTWVPSLPHEGILKLMREHDVLVFPSLFEGFGLVITEAMSQGLPVITTDRTAGPDIIQDGENGWLLQAGSTDRLAEALENVLSHPHLIANIGGAAMETARMRPWQIYGSEMLDTIIGN